MYGLNKWMTFNWTNAWILIELNWMDWMDRTNDWKIGWTNEGLNEWNGWEIEW